MLAQKIGRKIIPVVEKYTELQLIRHYAAKDGVRPAVTIPYGLDLATAQEDARLVIAKLQSKGVTSVLLAGDPVFPTFLTAEAGHA